MRFRRTAEHRTAGRRTLCHRVFQEGLLRPLSAAELSDGTLRYLLLIAALLTPRPPSLMVLNEPETSLHPDLLPALARLIIRASEQCRLGGVPCAAVDFGVAGRSGVQLHRAGENLRQTGIVGQRVLDEPAWNWPD
jgi:predicted ATPase